eukprot:112454-Chlamydomonas_euryale.AAC.1
MGLAGLLSLGACILHPGSPATTCAACAPMCLHASRVGCVHSPLRVRLLTRVSQNPPGHGRPTPDWHKLHRASSLCPATLPSPLASQAGEAVVSATAAHSQSSKSKAHT